MIYVDDLYGVTTLYMCILRDEHVDDVSLHTYTATGGMYMYYNATYLHTHTHT